MMAKSFYATCKKIMAEPGLLDRLKAEKYDVYISENFDVCGIGLFPGSRYATLQVG